MGLLGPKQPVQLYQVGDINNANFDFDDFIDALDESYCTPEERGDSAGSMQMD